MRDTNKTKITISLKQNEREALKAEAERQGVKLPTLCASLIRRHIKQICYVTERAKREAKDENAED